MALRLHSLSLRFGSQLALDQVSIRVRTGDCYGFIGHNGAGKTTAMRVALGLQRADSGRVIVDGFDASEHPREARARMGGLIEVPGFHGALDGARNLVLLARLQGMGRAEARGEAGRLLELVGLDGVGAKPVQAYSHGMRQRLGIAQALLGRPAYVLLDEPTNGLDPEGIAEIREILRRLTAEEGMSVLLSSHQLHEISDLCNRIGVIDRGRLRIEAETRELLQGARGRYELHTDDDERALGLLEPLGVTRLGAAGEGGTLVDLGEAAPGAAARALVDAGLSLERFGPRPPTLEEIYLRYAHDDGSLATPDADPGEVSAPSERRAPGGAVRRTTTYELSRWFARARFAALLSLPALLGGLALARRHARARESLEAVEDAQVFSTTDVTAFEGVAVGLQAGLPLAAVLLAGLASQSIAGEYARGTLRNVLLRPVKRVQVALGKALAHLGLGAALYALLALVTLAVSRWLFEFRDLAEILPNGESFPLVPAEELWPHLKGALLSPLPGLAAYAGVGFLAGAVARTAAGALALALGSVLLLDLSRAFARGYGVEGWLPSAYLPSPLGDTSFLKFYADVTQGVSNTAFAYADTALVVPLTWSLLAFALSGLILSRRPVP